MSLDVSTKRADEERAEVIVIGAGPVGLVSALQLGRAGIKTLVLERRPTFSVHPKAAGIHARTMEIYRQLGVSDSFRANGIHYNGGFGACWVTRLNGIEIGSMKAGGAPEQARVLRSWSPESQIFCTQD